MEMKVEPRYKIKMQINSIILKYKNKNTLGDIGQEGKKSYWRMLRDEASGTQDKIYLKFNVQFNFKMTWKYPWTDWLANG